MIPFLREAWLRFCRNPLAEALLTLLALLGFCTGLLTGLSAVAYLWHHNPQHDGPSPAAAIALTQHLQSAQRARSAFWLGLGLWILALLPVCARPVLGLPLFVFLMQPLWLALILADRFDIPAPLALRTLWHFTCLAPDKALCCALLGVLGAAGSLCFGIGFFITFPVATRATLTFLDACTLQLAAAVQRATD